MKRHILWASAMIALLAGQAATAQTITITPFNSIGPDGNSASLPGYNNNAINAISGSNIFAPSGTPGAAYSTVTGGVGANQVISTFSTGTNSWNGVVSNTGPFGTEFGNNLYQGARITSTGGATFQLADLRFTGGGNSLLDYNVDFSSGYTYSNTIVGLAPDGVTLITSGAATQNVIALYIVGAGTAYDASTFTTPITDQASMNAGISEILGLNNGGTVNISGQYSLVNSSIGPQTGPNSNLDIVPEPASLAVLGLGVVGLFGYVYRRRRPVSIACC